MFSSVDIFVKNNLPEKYFLYYEDVDFCQALKKNGVEIFYCPQALIFHKESASTKKKSYNYSYYFARNRYIYISTYYTGVAALAPKLYTTLWLMKKMLCKELDYRGVLDGVRDYKRGITGEKKDRN